MCTGLFCKGNEEWVSFQGLSTSSSFPVTFVCPKSTALFRCTLGRSPSSGNLRLSGRNCFHGTDFRLHD